MAPKRFTVSKVLDPTMIHDTSVSLCVHFSVQDFDKYEEYWSEYLEDIYLKEPKCLQYTQSYSEDETKLFLVEAWVDGESLCEHFGNVVPHLDKWHITPVEVHVNGPPSDMEVCMKFFSETPVKDIFNYYISDVRGFRRKNAHEIMRGKLH